MKKLLLILMIMFLLVSYLQSQEDYEDIAGFTLWEQDEEQADDDFEDFFDDPFAEQDKQPFRLKGRAFEIGLLNFNFGLSNNFISVKDIFTETIVIDFTDFGTRLKGFEMGFDFGIQPVFFNINIKDEWGFGLDIAKITTFGNINISGSLINFRQADYEEFGIGGGAFAEVGIPGFFHINNVWEDRRLKVKVRPAFYSPLVYVRPNMSYSLVEEANGLNLKIDLETSVYAPFSIEDIMNGGDPLSSLDIALGMDFSLGAEFPLFNWIDVGVNITNIPFIPAKMNHSLMIRGELEIDTSYLNIQDAIGGKASIDDIVRKMPGEDEEILTYDGNANYSALRPFKMVFTADFRLFQLLDMFETPVLSIIPILGFAVNPMNDKSRRGSIEAGLKFRANLGNIFIPTIGFVYEDRMWQNSLDLVLNLRAFELNLGLALQSQSFVKSWEGAGLRIALGTKFGW